MKFGWRKLFPLFVLGAVLVTLLALHHSRIFTVKKIICQTDQGACPDYVQAELDSHIGKSLFFSDFYEVGDQITQLAPFLARFELTKQFPDTITIVFFAAQPSYRYTEANGQTWLIDQAGYVINIAEQHQELPIVKASAAVPFRPDVRERIDAELNEQLLTVFESVQQHDLAQVQFILINQTEGALRLPDGKLVYFMLKDAQPQLAKLGYLLKHFSFSTFKEPISEVDLRFNQVILRNQQSNASISALLRQ